MFFVKTQSFWSGANQIAQYFRYLGKNTLPIYLISNIILFAFEKLRLLDWMDNYVNVFYIEFPVTLIIASFVSQGCLFIHSSLKRIEWAHNLIFGKNS